MVDPKTVGSVCILCRTVCVVQFDEKRLEDGDLSTPITYSCQFCGTYTVEYAASARVKDPSQVHLFAGLALEFKEIGRTLEVTEANIGSLISLAPTTFRGKLHRLLRALAKRSSELGRGAEVNFGNQFALAYARSGDECQYLLNCLSDEGLTKNEWLPAPPRSCNSTLTPLGWDKAEALAVPTLQSADAFVAMWFDPTMTPYFNDGIRPTAGKLGYDAIRVDGVQHDGKIDDLIIARIKESRFVIADYTGQRGGVYYEAGFARGLGLHVISMCRDDYFKDLHFDVRQFNTIEWHDVSDLCVKLDARIRAVLGYGPLDRSGLGTA